MKKIDFNEGWSYRRLDRKGAFTPVSIPHDAMFYENRTLNSRGGNNVGWFEGHDYLYSKHFRVPMEAKHQQLIIEFEGVYRHAEVYLNGKQAAFCPYGYTNFYVNTKGYLKYGETNEIQVIAKNADQPNSRWYSGAGIYRPVYLYVGEQNRIAVDGVRIRTVQIEPAVIEVDTKTHGQGNLKITILQNGSEVTSVRQAAHRDRHTTRITIPNAKLWCPQDPVLYQCRVEFENDTVTENFGIRTLKWSRSTGLTINGERVILRGACIHHDNGLLGACAFPEAEERKIRLLQENGYNAVRSAHNPCSKAMLAVCDRLGMLVMDEYLDVWYIHKTRYDYADDMEHWWQKDLKNMVKKDDNHPSVIMYSIGNEVSETAQQRGIALTGKMTRYLHRLDQTRPVTCGINIFFNFLSSIGFGVYSDEKAQKEVKKEVGSEFYNKLAGKLGDRAMKIGATLYPCDLKTKDAFANLDIAGYNYGILRYRHDLKKYKNRLILGTETFCKDAYDFWELAKENPGIIGDFVWAGMDYLGEAGIGAWEYEDYAPKKAPECGWLTAGSGRLNILGRPGGEALYTKVALEQEQGPFLAVKPVYQTGSHSPSAWKMTDAMASWTYPGCGGMKAEVEVYARAATVELFVNEKKVGRKILKNTCRAVFQTRYEDGKLTAVARNEQGLEIGRTFLQTGGKETVLSVVPEQKQAAPGQIIYIQIRYTDENGILKPMEKGRIHVTVSGGILLGLGNACSYNAAGYRNETTSVYYGEAMAAVRAQDDKTLVLQASDGKREQSVQIPINPKPKEG